MAQFGTVTNQEGTYAATNRCCFSCQATACCSWSGFRSIATEIWVSVCDRTPALGDPGLASAAATHD